MQQTALGLIQTDQYGDLPLVKQLHKGGFGIIWLAERNNQTFVIKVPKDKEAEEGVRREVELTQRLHHPGVIQQWLLTTKTGGVVAVMEYYPKNMAEYLDRNLLTLGQVIEYIVEICNIVQYVHDNDVVHLDIRDLNILVGVNGQLVLTDFGIAFRPSHGLPTKPYGNFEASAPEVYEMTPSRATDVYALGILAYKLFAGVPPFEHKDVSLYYQLHKYYLPPIIGIPTQIENVIAKALEKNPDDRWESACAFGEALQLALQETETKDRIARTEPLRSLRDSTKLLQFTRQTTQVLRRTFKQVVRSWFNL